MALAVAEFAGTPGTWDNFVRAQVGSTHCHVFGWKRVMEDVFGHRTYYLSAVAGGEIRGVLPLVRVRSALFGDYLVSMSFVNYGGPLGDPAAVASLCRAAVDLAQDQGVDLLELRSRCALPTGLDVSHRKITVMLDLTGDRPLWERLDSKVRSQIRRPMKAGVTYRIGPEELVPFHRVYAAHMRDLGTPAQPLRFFTALQEQFGNEVVFGCAYLDGRPIASGCGFAWAGEFEMTWASALLQHKTIAANMGLYWHFMERAIEHGLTRFNFGRCTPGGGTHRFKRQWGGQDEPLWWYNHSPRATAVRTPGPDHGRWAWGPRLWKRLPLPIATALGPHIVRSIP